MRPRRIPVLLALAVLSCASSRGDEKQLLALHEEGLRAHRESDVDLLLEAEEDDYGVRIGNVSNFKP